MATQQLRFIKDTLKSKHRYDQLPDKALHKLSYLIYSKSKERGADVSIPYFWYRYGVLTQPTPDSPNRSSSGMDPDSEEIVNRVSEQVLQDYYSASLVEITDITYEDAPYDVFPNWRALDKQISNLKDNYNPFFDNTPIKAEVEKKVEEVYDSFPTDEFPQHTSDLATWYFAMTREIDMDLKDVQRMQEINTEFWGIFTLSVAREHHPNMSQEDVLNVLGISSFEGTTAERREHLYRLEGQALDDRLSSDDSALTGGTDAMIEPILESL